MLTPHGLSGNAIGEEHVWPVFTRKSLALSWSFLGASEAIAPLVESSQERRGGGEEGGIPVLTSFLEP